MNDQTLTVQSMKASTHGFASLAVPTYRASTIVFDSAEEYRNRGKRAPEGYSYGLYGTPTTRELEQKMTALENGVRTFLTPSGQASNAFTLLALLSAGDRLLMADNVYPATRAFAECDLRKLGIDTVFFDPTSLEDLTDKLRDGAKMVWCESPGSTTMEVTDLPRVAELSHAAGALVGCDNTWATPLNLKPLDLGADVVTEALTKYVAGHSDVFMGSLTIRDEKLVETMRSTLGRYGIGASPDDASLVLRGMETLAVRLSYSARVATDIAAWFELQSEVEKVLFPPLAQAPGHAIWKRDFRGASGVFSVIFQRGLAARVLEALDALRIVSIGASWGGTRSLVAPMPVVQHRSAMPWSHEDLVLRFSIGLEAEQDIYADMERFMQRLSTGPQ